MSCFSAQEVSDYRRELPARVLMASSLDALPRKTLLCLYFAAYAALPLSFPNFTVSQPLIICHTHGFGGAFRLPARYSLLFHRLVILSSFAHFYFTRYFQRKRYGDGTTKHFVDIRCVQCRAID